MEKIEETEKIEDVHKKDVPKKYVPKISLAKMLITIFIVAKNFKMSIVISDIRASSDP